MSDGMNNDHVALDDMASVTPKALECPAVEAGQREWHNGEIEISHNMSMSKCIWPRLRVPVAVGMKQQDMQFSVKEGFDIAFGEVSGQGSIYGASNVRCL